MMISLKKSMRNKSKTASQMMNFEAMNEYVQIEPMEAKKKGGIIVAEVHYD